MRNKMFEVSKVFTSFCPLIVIVCKMVCRTLLLNKTFKVSKVSSSFVH